MSLSNIADKLWGNRARFRYLIIASLFLLLTSLGGREIWTQEHRWADIVSGMFFRHDFLHPYLNETAYYDKPLLSYWLIAIVAKLTQGISTWALRLPSALAGILAVSSIYYLGSVLKNKQLGLLSGWLLLTTFYFVFWARTSSADMLNLAGSLLAITWYMYHRERANLFHYAVFFSMLALTSLCKGLVGAIIPLIAVAIDIYLQRSFRKHLRFSLLLALIPAFVIYLFPFWASSYFNGGSYSENGLYLVYRENFLRYFQPFDHKGAFYTYFLYLPIYLLPYTIFFIPALWMVKSRFHSMSLNTKWLTWTLFILFLFFSLSGSRRSYYVLPLVPFAILFIADWLLENPFIQIRQTWLAGFIIFTFFSLFITLDVLPSLYNTMFGLERFSIQLKKEANRIRPWNTWNVVMLDAESKINYYLPLPPNTPWYFIDGNMRNEQTRASLAKAWPILKNKPQNTIFITRKQYEPLLSAYFVGYQRIIIPIKNPWPFSFLKQSANAPIAFIPASHSKASIL